MGELNSRSTSTALLTDDGSERSHNMGCTDDPSSSCTFKAFSWDRTVPYILAPRKAKTLAVSRPRPVLTPVITIVLPVRSNPSVTSSAVDAKPNPLGPTGFLKTVSNDNFYPWIYFVSLSNDTVTVSCLLVHSSLRVYPCS